MTEWHIIRKGERRPRGRVLVAYYDMYWHKVESMLASTRGEPVDPPMLAVGVAWWWKGRWNSSCRELDTKHVIAWMPMPEPPDDMDAELAAALATPAHGQGGERE